MTKLLGRKKKADKPPKARLDKVASSRGMFRASLLEFRSDWLPYAKILAIVSVPSDLISAISTDPFTSAYVSFAALIMNVALLWAVVRRGAGKKVPTIADAYYKGSAALVRFILVSVALVIMLIPAALGAALYAAGMVAINASAIYGTDQILLAFVSLLIASPSFYMLIRYGLSPFAVVGDELRPIAALRQSRRYTLGRFWPVTGRFLMLGVLLAVLSIPAIVITLVLSLLHLSAAATIFFEIATALIALPVGNIYLLKLYRNLASTAAAVPVSATDEAAA